MWEFINQSGLVLQMEQKSKRRKNRIYIFITYHWTEKGKAKRIKINKNLPKNQMQYVPGGNDCFERRVWYFLKRVEQGVGLES